MGYDKKTKHCLRLAALCLVVGLADISVAQHPQQPYLDSGKKYYKEKNYYAAIEMLKDYLKSDIDNFGAHKLLVDAYFKADRADECLEFYKKLKQAFPANRVLSDKLAERYYGLGVGSVKRQDFRQAKLELDLVMVLNPSYKNVALLIKKCQEKLATLEQAEKKEELAKNSYAAGVKCLRTEDFTGAIANFRKASRHDPRFKQMVGDWLPNAAGEAQKKDTKKALNYYRLCLALDMDNMQVHESLVAFSKAEGQGLFMKIYNELKATYPQSRAIRETLPEKYFQEGMTHRQNGDFRLALQKFNDAAFFNPGYQGLAAQLVECKKQIVILEQREKNQKLAENCYAKGEMLLQQDKTGLAVAEFKRASGLDPRMKLRAPDWIAKGRAGLKAGKKKNAIEYFQLALALDAGNQEANISLLDTYQSLNYATQIGQHCKNFAVSFPAGTETNQKVAESIYNKGMELKNAQKYSEALQQFKMVAMINRHFKGNKENIVFCQAEVKRLAVLAANRKQAQADYALGLKLFNKKQYKTALVKFSDAVRLDDRFKERAGQWYDKGQKAFAQKAFLAAVNAYQVAVALDMEDLKVHQQLVEAWVKRSKGLAEVKLYYADLQKKSPGLVFLNKQLPDHFLNAGQACLKDNNPELGLVYFSLVKQLDPRNTEAGPPITFCQQQIKIQQKMKQAQTHYQKGMQELKSGRLKKAALSFEKAKQFDPSLADYLDRLRQEGREDLKDKKVTSACQKLGLVLLKNITDVELHKEVLDAGIKNGTLKPLHDLYGNLIAEYPFEPTIRKVLPAYYYDQAMKYKNSGKYQAALLHLEVVKMLKPQYKDVDIQIRGIKRSMR